MSESSTTARSSSGTGFLAGLTVGVLAGVAGYYLFGTKQGQEVRRKIAQEWHEAQQVFGSSVDQSTPDAEKWQQFFSQMARELGFERHRAQLRPKTAAKTSVFVKKSKQSKKSATKFSGV